jgi:putative membrane protein
MKFPYTLLAAYITLFVICAIAPYDRAVWFAENFPIILIVVGIVIFSRFHRFSNTAYALMAVLIMLHTVGGHYTFERVPFGFVTDLFAFERNHYDRIAHFSVGFYAFAIAELLVAKQLVNSRTILYLFPIFTIFTVAAVYEVFEWQFALLADPDAGIAVLGSQGDVWDAQKDMLADGLGAIFATLLFALRQYFHKTR